jgi:hypothetical protein
MLEEGSHQLAIILGANQQRYSAPIHTSDRSESVTYLLFLELSFLLLLLLLLLGASDLRLCDDQKRKIRDVSILAFAFVIKK